MLDGFTLNLIDTPSLLDQDAVSDRVSGGGAGQGQGQGQGWGCVSGQGGSDGAEETVPTEVCLEQAVHSVRCRTLLGAASSAYGHPCPPPVLLQRLEAVAKAVDGRPVDVVLYLDRLDNYSLGPLDKRVSPACLLTAAWAVRQQRQEGAGCDPAS